MSLQDNFKAFLHDIEPSRSTVDEIAGAHMALRSYLEGHDCYSQHCRSTYLSGPYAKNTSIRPVKDEDHRDADVVVDYLRRKRPPVTGVRPPNRDHVTMRHVRATPSMRPLPRLVPLAIRTRRGSDANGEGDKGQAGPGVACKGHGGKARLSPRRENLYLLRNLCGEFCEERKRGSPAFPASSSEKRGERGLPTFLDKPLKDPIFVEFCKRGDSL